MAYNIGQLRKNQVGSFAKDILGWTETTVASGQSEEGTISFDNFAIDLTTSSNFPTMTSDKYYYLHFQVAQTQDGYDQNFVVRLQKKESTSEDDIQDIASYTVQSGVEGSYIDFEMIIAPNSSYEYLILYLKRNSLDYSDATEGGRKMEVKIKDFCVIDNVLDNVFADLGISSVSKIGIQSAPGTLMCINGEEIRVGRSGIYEINNGVYVSFVGFVEAKNEETGIRDINYFILDYSY